MKKTKFQFYRLNQPNCYGRTSLEGRDDIQVIIPWSNTEGDISYNHPLYDSAPPGSLNKCQVYLKLCEQRHFKSKVQCRARWRARENFEIEIQFEAISCWFWQQIVHFNFHYTFNLTKLFWPPPFTTENFLVPPFRHLKTFLAPLPFCPAPPPRYLWTLPKRLCNHFLIMLGCVGVCMCMWQRVNVWPFLLHALMNFTWTLVIHVDAYWVLGSSFADEVKCYLRSSCKRM